MSCSTQQVYTGHLVRELNRLEPIARKLGCREEPADVERIIPAGAGYQWQRKIVAANSWDLRAVVQDYIARMHIA